MKTKVRKLLLPLRNSRNAGVTESSIQMNIVFCNTKVRDSQEDTQLLLKAAVDYHSCLWRWSGQFSGGCLQATGKTTLLPSAHAFTLRIAKSLKKSTQHMRIAQDTCQKLLKLNWSSFCRKKEEPENWLCKLEPEKRTVIIKKKNHVCFTFFVFFSKILKMLFLVNYNVLGKLKQRTLAFCSVLQVIPTETRVSSFIA